MTALAAQSNTAVTLSIIIVTWNCQKMVLDCLRAVFASELPISFEVILVDNASTDGTTDQVAALFPIVQLISNADNRGFAKGNNQGFRLARGRFLMLLNPDAFPATTETFARVISLLESEKELAGLGCRLVHGNGSHQVGDAGFRPSIFHVLAYVSGLSQLLPGRVGLFLGAVDSQRPWLDVDWICGAFFVVRREVVERVGGLDESFFMYAEDIEWGCRMRRLGYRIGYLPNETVIHLQGGTQTASGQPQTSTRWLDSLAILYVRLNKAYSWTLFRVALALGFLLRALIYRLLAVVSGNGDRTAKSRAMLVFSRHVWSMKRPARPEAAGIPASRQFAAPP